MNTQYDLKNFFLRLELHKDHKTLIPKLFSYIIVFQILHKFRITKSIMTIIIVQTTYFHETFHYYACGLTGGNTVEIILTTRGGVTHCGGGNFFLTSISGYLFSTLFLNIFCFMYINELSSLISNGLFLILCLIPTIKLNKVKMMVIVNFLPFLSFILHWLIGIAIREMNLLWFSMMLSCCYHQIMRDLILNYKKSNDMLVLLVAYNKRPSRVPGFIFIFLCIIFMSGLIYFYLYLKGL